MTWRRRGEKLLFEPMMISLLALIWVSRPQWIDLYQHHFCLWFSHTKYTTVASISGNIHVFCACFQFVKTIHIYTLVISLKYAPGFNAWVQKLGFIIKYGLLIEDIWPWNLLYIYKRDIWTKVHICFWLSNILSTPKLYNIAYIITIARRYNLIAFMVWKWWQLYAKYVTGSNAVLYGVYEILSSIADPGCSTW